MNGIHVAGILAFGLISFVPAQASERLAPAQAGEALAKARGCLSCHMRDKKLVGPAYKDVAAKYRGDTKALVSLAAKVKSGGKGVWGAIPMPPTNVSDEEAKKLVAWILALK